MRYSFAILSLALCAFLLAGCGQQNAPDVTAPFIGGTEGLVMSFQEGAPPREIYDAGDSSFSIGVQIQNQGEADIGVDAVTPSDNHFGQIEISGINPLQFNNPQMIRTFDDERTSLTRVRKAFDGTMIASAPDIINFEGFKYMPDDRGDSQRTIRATLCYDYTTFVNTQVCIKSSTLETTADNSICTLSNKLDPKNSGAPVHVTAISQNPLGKDKIQILFTIENVNKGLIFAPHNTPFTGVSSSSFDGLYCDNVPNNPYRNKVYVKVGLSDESSTSWIHCNRLNDGPEGMVDLFAGAPAILTCTIEAPPGTGNRAYTDTLKIDLKYAYSTFIETPVRVRDVSAGQQ